MNDMLFNQDNDHSVAYLNSENPSVMMRYSMGIRETIANLAKYVIANVWRGYARFTAAFNNGHIFAVGGVTNGTDLGIAYGGTYKSLPF